MKVASHNRGGDTILYDSALVDDIETLGFDPEVLRERGLVSGAATGRDGSEAVFFTFNNHRLVVKHYRRGGLFASLFGDRYLWLGQARTRPQREWELLLRMRELGLPVPQPVACRVSRSGIVYRGDMVMLQLEDCRTLAQWLEQGELNASAWSAVGSLVRRFHDAGIYHADLNAKNVMRDTNGELYLIDFDKGRVRDRRGGWQTGNLLRLRRSLEKLRSLQDGFCYRDSDWTSVETGYISGHTPDS